MKTKEFIKRLQDVDPTGEEHIRISGGVITGVELKEGYWDGPFDYVEKGEDGKLKWVASTKGNKVDVHTMDLYDFAEWYDGDWEEMKKHITIEYGYVNKDREEEFMKHAKRECDEYNEISAEIKESIKNK